MKKLLLAAAFTAISTSAIADVKLLKAEKIFTSKPITETVHVCKRTGDDKTTEGALLGGLIGSNNGNALGGAIIGGILGDLVGQEKCQNETRVIGHEQIHTGYTITLDVDGVEKKFRISK